MIDEIGSHRFERLITAQTGLQLRSRERDTLRGTLNARMAALRLPYADQYHQLLESGTPESLREWEQITASLTNNESYFFRDKGQMALLRERILPELIARNQARRTLRLWSAGCSTGEEAYSLAILVDELLPRHGTASGAGWQIVILGTDIDERALQQARRGLYSAWSFRTMEPERQQHWFHRQEDGWQVTQTSRSLVTFARCNLVADPFPSTAMGLYEMDLILCRNVFIYFASEAISIVLPKFAQTLREGGYLMTGHAETQNQILEPLQTRLFPESVVYQRVRKPAPGLGATSGAAPSLSGTVTGVTRRAEAAVHRPPSLPAAKHEVPSIPQPTASTSVLPLSASEVLAEAEACYAARDYAATIRALSPLSEPAGAEALLLLAQAYANLGRYAEATDFCQRLRNEFPLASEPYMLLASIAQEQGHQDEAKLLLKKALYLAPTSPAAYLELAELYQSEADRERARKMRATALELLRNLPPDSPVGSSGGPNALEWVRHLQQVLKEGE